LQVLISTSFACKDPDEALRAATEVAALAGEVSDKKAEANAKTAMAIAHVANEDAEQGLEASLAGAELCKASGDKAGQAVALAVAYDIQIFLGRPVAASSAARDVLVVGKGDKKAEAVATMMLGSVNTATQDALEACRQALGLFKTLGDKVGEAAAQVALANAHLCQGGKQAEEGLGAAKDALAAFKSLSSKGGEAAALSTIAAAHTQKGDASEAEKAVREALAIFRELREFVGEAYATALLKGAKAAAAAPGPVKVSFDEAAAIVHIELSDNVTPASLQEVIATLQASKGASCIVINLEGSPDQSPVTQAAQKGLGMFLVGLRMIGLPVICAIYGKISGPMWGIVLASDYRIAATSTAFMCPIWGKPECMGALVGHNTAVQLCMSFGPKDSLAMLEHGVIHQLQKGKDNTRKAAFEMAKRVASTPAMACRKQPQVLSQAMEKYALAAAQGILPVS